MHSHWWQEFMFSNVFDFVGPSCLCLWIRSTYKVIFNNRWLLLSEPVSVASIKGIETTPVVKHKLKSCRGQLRTFILIYHFLYFGWGGGSIFKWRGLGFSGRKNSLLFFGTPPSAQVRLCNKMALVKGEELGPAQRFRSIAILCLKFSD